MATAPPPPPAPPAPLPQVAAAAEVRRVIRPPTPWTPIDWAELWAHRELLYFLIWRDLKTRYKQSLLGLAWVILQPLLSALLFALVFGVLVRVPSDGVPYLLHYLAALLPWQFFAGAVTASVNSLVSGAALVRKVYFPRLLLPVVAVAGSLVDFACAWVVLLGAMLYYQAAPTWHLVWLPAYLALALALALGVGLWSSALHAQYRDVGRIMAFLVQLWMYASPVIYPSSLVPRRLWNIYALNPMVHVIDGFRLGLFGAGGRPGPMTAAAAALALTVLVSGLYLFKRREREFADVV